MRLFNRVCGGVQQVTAGARASNNIRHGRADAHRRSIVMSDAGTVGVHVHLSVKL
jgi:hypothetical protein